MNETLPSSRRCHAWLQTAALLLAGGLLSVADAGVPAGGYSFAPAAKEVETYRLIRDDGQQQRPQMVLDPRLCAAARKQAEDTQRRKFFSHLNPDGVNANRRAIDEGYPLPAHYDPTQNYIESMAGSTVDTPSDAVARWRASAPHAEHVFAKSADRRQQVVVGVGHAPASRLGYATYIFISAPPPVGQNGSVSSSSARRLRLATDSDGTIRYGNAQTEGIFEVWKAGRLLAPWGLDRCVVVDASGIIELGVMTSDRGFFRLRHVQ